MRIGIIGCAGRMGRALIKEVLATKGSTLSGGVERAGNEYIGEDLSALIGAKKNTGAKVYKRVEDLIAKTDVVINFSLPQPTMDIARILAKHKKAQVIGTTGLSEKQKAELKKLAKSAPIVHAHNMSVGVNVLLGLVEQVAAMLPPDIFDIEVVEMHHRNKIDAPSGTALSLGDAAAKGRGKKLSAVQNLSREGNVGARKQGEIGFATLRGGDVVGDHTVIFASNYERIELTHKAASREVFAHGAVRAALWLKGKKSGLYSMKDVLGL